jgi:hypothetical protein
LSASEAERTCDCGDGVQWPKERKPMCFMGRTTEVRRSVLALCSPKFGS